MLMIGRVADRQTNPPYKSEVILVEKRALKMSINIVGIIVRRAVGFMQRFRRSIDCARQSMQQAALEFAGE